MKPQAPCGSLHGIPIVAVDEDIVAEARGILGLKQIVIGTDFTALTNAEQMAVLQHEAAHCLGYHLELRIVVSLIFAAVVVVFAGWDVAFALAVGAGGMLAVQHLAHAQEFEADRAAARLGHRDGMRAFVRRSTKLPPSELHPSPRARLRNLS